MFGSHLSIAGGLVNALNEAETLNMDCVQVFTKNQRQWKAAPLSDEARTQWLAKLKALGWHKTRGPARVVSHNSYLINLASPDRALREKSIALQREEVERCETLKIRLLVSHPGAHMGKPRARDDVNDLEAKPNKDELAGLKRITKSLDQLHKDLPGYATITCLETTVGAGTTLGYSFHQLAYLREHIQEADRVGYCFDTCHVTAAGYDMTTRAKAAAVLGQWDEVCGHANLCVFHLNDSVGELGSRKDRHAHIGHGTCGLACFGAIVNHRGFAGVPKVLETPKDRDEKGVPWDVRNIRRLKRLVRAPKSGR